MLGMFAERCIQLKNTSSLPSTSFESLFGGAVVDPARFKACARCFHHVLIRGTTETPCLNRSGFKGFPKRHKKEPLHFDAAL